MSTSDADPLTTDQASTLALARQWLVDGLTVLDDQGARLEAAGHAMRAAHIQRADIAAVLERHARRLSDVAEELRGTP